MTWASVSAVTVGNKSDSHTSNNKQDMPQQYLCLWFLNIYEDTLWLDIMLSFRFYLQLVKLKSSLRKFYGRHHNLVDRYGISVSQMTTDIYVPLVVNTSLSFPHLWLITGFVNRSTQWVSLVEHELLTFPEHLSSSPVISGVRVTRSLVLWVCFIDRSLSFCTFSFRQCGVCSS